MSHQKLMMMVGEAIEPKSSTATRKQQFRNIYIKLFYFKLKIFNVKK
jgi:hypothetical protein